MRPPAMLTRVPGKERQGNLILVDWRSDRGLSNMFTLLHPSLCGLTHPFKRFHTSQCVTPASFQNDLGMSLVEVWAPYVYWFTCGAPLGASRSLRSASPLWDCWVRYVGRLPLFNGVLFLPAIV